MGPLWRHLIKLERVNVILVFIFNSLTEDTIIRKRGYNKREREMYLLSQEKDMCGKQRQNYVRGPRNKFLSTSCFARVSATSLAPLKILWSSTSVELLRSFFFFFFSFNIFLSYNPKYLRSHSPLPGVLKRNRIRPLMLSLSPLSFT